MNVRMKENKGHKKTPGQTIPSVVYSHRQPPLSLPVMRHLMVKQLCP
jgi:hypothetical protein